MRPAPAAKSAERTTSKAAGGTNTTSFRFNSPTLERACDHSLRRGVLLIVDLRALQLAAVVDVDRLPLREHVERGLPRFAMAVAGLLHPAERQVHLGARRSGVDVGDPGLQVPHRLERLVDVAREDRR